MGDRTLRKDLVFILFIFVVFAIVLVAISVSRDGETTQEDSIETDSETVNEGAIYNKNDNKTLNITNNLERVKVDIHVYDSQGSHTGINPITGETERNVSRSYYFGNYGAETGDTMLLYDTSEDYTFVFTPQFKPSQKEGVSTVTLSQQADDTRKTITYYDVYFTENTTAKVPINLTSTDYTMYIFENGKVTTREPDEIYVDFKPTAKIISPENGSNFLAGENIFF